MIERIDVLPLPLLPMSSTFCFIFGQARVVRQSAQPAARGRPRAAPRPAAPSPRAPPRPRELRELRGALRLQLCARSLSEPDRRAAPRRRRDRASRWPRGRTGRERTSEPRRTQAAAQQQQQQSSSRLQQQTRSSSQKHCQSSCSSSRAAAEQHCQWQQRSSKQQRAGAAAARRSAAARRAGGRALARPPRARGASASRAESESALDAAARPAQTGGAASPARPASPTAARGWSRVW
jgi:hypothetical protein